MAEPAPINEPVGLAQPDLHVVPESNTPIAAVEPSSVGPGELTPEEDYSTPEKIAEARAQFEAERDLNLEKIKQANSSDSHVLEEPHSPEPLVVGEPHKIPILDAIASLFRKKVNPGQTPSSTKRVTTDEAPVKPELTNTQPMADTGHQ